jgi:hypothetical protein
MPQPDSGTDASSQNRGSKKWKLICLVVIACFALFFINENLKPTIDPGDTKELVINSSGGAKASDSKPTDETQANQLNQEAMDDGSITSAISQGVVDAADHPLEPVLMLGQKSLEHIDSLISDYSSTMISQVRIDGELLDEKYVFLKIRHEKLSDPKLPFAVYTIFLRPKSNVGQEAIWVKGENDDKIIAHTTGLMNVKRFYLDQDGILAMEGNLHPIREIGFRNLVVKMMETTKSDLDHDESDVKITKNAEINGRQCTLIEASHPVKREHFEYHIAKIFIDDELNVPIAFEGYTWPEKEGDEPVLTERYYYTDLKINIGVTDSDFDPSNEAYNYPTW